MREHTPRSRAAVLAGLALAVVAPGVSSQTGGDGVARVDAQAEVQAALFHASATLAAVERAKDEEIARRGTRILDLQAQVDRARSERTGEVERLQTELSAAEAGFVEALADRDRAYAEEIAVFREAVEDIASTPGGAAALARFNAGDEIGALAVLDDLRAARDAARQRRADVESAAEARRIATLALDARQRGTLRTSDVITRYEEITTLDPDGFWDWIELSRLYEDAGNLASAKQSVENALTVAASERDRSVALARLGLIQSAEGDLPAAIGSYGAAVDAAERRAAASPNHPDAQRDLAIYLERLARALSDQGEFSGALDRFGESLDIREQLYRANPTTESIRELEVSALLGGDLFIRMSDVPAAINAYRTALGMAEQLASSDPGNLGWQRDLSLTLFKLGDALVRQPDIPGAHDALTSGLAIVQRLVAVDPDNTVWLLDLSLFHDRLGAVMREQGDPAGALESHHASRQIIERLRVLDPGNTDWLQSLSGVEGQIGLTLLVQGDSLGALEHLEAAVAITKQLVAEDSTNATWQAAVAHAAATVGDVLRWQGEFARAADTYDEAIDHFAHAMEMATGDREVQRHLRIVLSKRGDMLLAVGDPVGALREHEAALEIALTLAESLPSDPTRQKDLIISYVKMQEVTGDRDYARRALEVALRMQAEGILAAEDEWMIEDLRRRAGG